MDDTDNDRELFDDARSDGPEPAPEPVVDQGQPRDDHGRFAPKAPAEPESQPEPAQTPEPAPQAQREGWVPPHRLREATERAANLERQLQEAQAQWQRQIAELQGRLPKPEPAQRPDLYENPDGFVEHGVRAAVDPLRSEVSQIREFYSRRDAERTFGEEKVREAYYALDQAARSGDPDAQVTAQRVRQSMDPFGDIMQWHQTRSVYKQIGADPNAWFEKTLEERLTSDPKFAASVVQKLQQSARKNPQGNNFQLPPSLNKTPSASPPAGDDDDDGEAGLLRSALR